MCFASPRLTTSLASTHLPWRASPAWLTPDHVAEATVQLALFLRRLGRACPRLAICSLNLHAGIEQAARRRGAAGHHSRHPPGPAASSQQGAARRPVGRRIGIPLGARRHVRRCRRDVPRSRPYPDQTRCVWRRGKRDPGVEPRAHQRRPRHGLRQSPGNARPTPAACSPLFGSPPLRLAQRLVHRP
jgi:hypothetical protein